MPQNEKITVQIDKETYDKILACVANRVGVTSTVEERINCFVELGVRKLLPKIGRHFPKEANANANND